MDNLVKYLTILVISTKISHNSSKFNNLFQAFVATTTKNKNCFINTNFLVSININNYMYFYL